MNISSSSSSSCIFKEVHAHLPDETAVAVALRKKMEREGDTKDYGITDQPTITVTIRGADSDSDTDAPTIPWGISDDDNEFSPMNPELAEDDEIAIARTILKSFHIDKSDAAGPSAVADTAKEKQNAVTPSAVADSAKEKGSEDVSAAVAIDRKDDGPTAVPKKRKTDTNPVEPLTKRDVADTNLVEPPPKLTTLPSHTSADFCESDTSDDPDGRSGKDKAADPQAETKDETPPKLFLKPRCKEKPGKKPQPIADPAKRSRSGRRSRSRRGRRYRSRSERRNSSSRERRSCSRSGCRNRSRGGRRSRSRSGRHNRSRSESSNRSRGRLDRGNRKGSSVPLLRPRGSVLQASKSKGRGRATTMYQLSETTTKLS